MEKKVVIVTPTYKRAHILANTVRSILLQTYTNFEYIILDDNQNDDVEEVAETRRVVEAFEDKRVRYVKNTTNLGHPNIFHKALSFASGDYYMLYGDDDELLPDTLELFVNYLDSNPFVSIVHGMDMFRDEKGCLTKPNSPVTEDVQFDATVYLQSLLQADGKYGISLSACLFRTEIITGNKISVFGSYQWDVYFFAQYFLFSKKVGFLNMYADIRNAAVHHTGKDGSELYLFYIQVENLMLILKFISEFRFQLAVRNIDITQIRFRIGVKLLQQSMHIKDFSRGALCISAGFKSILRACADYFLYFTFRPVTLIFGKFNGLYRFILQKK
jgi:glycosyltransferase involved in cell wall biosynthesis